MSTRHSRRPGIQQVLLLLVVSLLVTTTTAVAHAARPVARTSSAEPVARASHTALNHAVAQRAAAERALARAARNLKRCRRVHPGHCRRACRKLRRARTRLARAKRRVKELRAHVSSALHATAPASPASPADPTTNFSEPFVKGIDTNIEGWGAEALPQIASEMSSLGVNWAREDLEWSKTEPQPGVFDWSSFDNVVYAAKAEGITILPVLSYAPSWTGPTDAAAYAAFVQAAVERYGPGTRANLRWWELWNEPYDSYAWSGRTPEPEAYAHDVVAAAQAAKAVAPSVKLLVSADYNDSPQAGGTSRWQTAWIDDLFAAEPALGQWIDGVSVHPYGDDPALPLTQTGGWQDASGNWSFQRIDTIRAKFLAHGVNIPFWITEAGWPTEEVSEAQQAKDYADLIPQVAARPWIRALFPYCLREFQETPSKESSFGLLKFGSWQPKPAFTALQKGLPELS